MERYARSQVGFAGKSNAGKGGGNIGAMPDGSFLFIIGAYTDDIRKEVAAHLHVPRERVVLYHDGRVIPVDERDVIKEQVLVCHVRPSGNCVKVRSCARFLSARIHDTARQMPFSLE